MPMLSCATLKLLREGKNLLAFSAGIDSSALFFLLIEAKIPFDIAIVDYGVRPQSKEEVSYAQALALKHKLTCHLHHAPQLEKNFEAKAREIRYEFFDTLITKFGYNNLLTAHHLGDRFEWMLMQFCKGAGCAELSSMREIEERPNFTLVRPLLHLEKSELQNYLETQGKKYFVDESNLDESIKRNYFRHNHAQPLLSRYAKGIKKSFEYIDLDAQELIEEAELHTIKDFCYFHATHSKRSDIYTIDRYLKNSGLMISAKERELLNKETTVILARRYVVTWHKKLVFIAPYIQITQTIPDKFKEKMRLKKIEPKLRAYLFSNLEVLESLEGSRALQ